MYVETNGRLDNFQCEIQLKTRKFVHFKPNDIKISHGEYGHCSPNFCSIWDKFVHWNRIARSNSYTQIGVEFI